MTVHPKSYFAFVEIIVLLLVIIVTAGTHIARWWSSEFLLIAIACRFFHCPSFFSFARRFFSLLEDVRAGYTVWGEREANLFSV